MSPIKPGTLRIVAGSRRGRRLKVPGEGSVRPTGDRVREAIFDVLGPVDGLRALDLFAGSGAMGLEALSRGAAHCVFVEADARVAAVLRQNIQALGFEAASSQVVVADYHRAVERLAGPSAGFDLLFIDPPYRMLREVAVMLAPLLPALLADDGLVVVEAPSSVPVEMGMDPVFDRVYGDTRVVMLKMRRSQ
jgi:16S rRNA (guanine966-N2)-methyltransferase